jgi:hypothetical protein
MSHDWRLSVVDKVLAPRTRIEASPVAGLVLTLREGGVAIGRQPLGRDIADGVGVRA